MCHRHFEVVAVEARGAIVRIFAPLRLSPGKRDHCRALHASGVSAFWPNRVRVGIRCAFRPHHHGVDQSLLADHHADAVQGEAKNDGGYGVRGLMKSEPLERFASGVGERRQISHAVIIAPMGTNWVRRSAAQESTLGR